MNQKEKEELVKYRFGKANDTFVEAEVQIKNELWNVAINRRLFLCGQCFACE